MSETTKVISDLDKLFTEIEINGETFKSENYVPQDSEARVIKAQKTEETNITPQTEEDDTPKEPVLLTKEINDLDLLFSAIEVNGEVYKSDKYTPPIPKTSVIKAPPKEPDKPTAEIISEPVIGQTVQAVNLNGTIHDFEDIEAMQTAESASHTANQASQSVSSIQNLVPSQASASNKLADKDFVNSSIATNTSNFIGTFNTLEELESQTATNNDYAFWKTTDEDGNVLFKRYKYVADDGTWQFEYDLNNSSFTAEQWSAINSGITSELVSSMTTIGRIFDVFYPIGSMYWTEDKNFDPNTAWGGTWTRITNRFIYAYDGSENLGTQAGSSSVTLSSSNLPKHQHGLNGHTHGMQHYHDRGTMNIYGQFYNAGGGSESDYTGAFSYTRSGSMGFGSGNGSHGWAQFNANRTGAWTGKTSGSLANQTTGNTTAKTTTDGNSGNTTDGGFSNSAFSIMPPYERAYCWKRTE